MPCMSSHFKNGHFPFVRASRILNVNKTFMFMQCNAATRNEKAFFPEKYYF